jgi:hypothetical protein
MAVTVATVAGVFEARRHLALSFACPLLDAANQFVLLALDELQIIVRELGPFLLQSAFDDVPVSFDG